VAVPIFRPLNTTRSSLAWRSRAGSSPSPSLLPHRTQSRVRRNNLHITNGNQSTKSASAHYYWTSTYMVKHTNWQVDNLICIKDTSTDLSTTKMCLHAFISRHNRVTYFGTELVLENTIAQHLLKMAHSRQNKWQVNQVFPLVTQITLTNNNHDTAWTTTPGLQMPYCHVEILHDQLHKEITKRNQKLTNNSN
jgi:hypothetical protein